ncbi:S8 family serine peptidase [Solwaraspora sp. WMMB335]|uniref:S8 family serine peptidase n=1 Tax=Solwaraspora sp. WMMB335 TaxID=3404118 RepID=UPI003B9454BF
MTQVPGDPGHPDPGHPTLPSYPGYPNRPEYPGYPGYPWAVPGQPWADPGQPAAASPWPAIVAVLVGVWSVAVTTVGQVGGWLTDQVLLASGLPTPAPVWPLLGIGTALLVGLPAMLLAVVPRSPAVRATGRAWLIGALAVAGCGLLRAVPTALHELYLAGLTLLAAGAAVGLRALRRRTGHGPDRAAAPIAAPTATPTATQTESGRDRERDRAVALLLAGAAGLAVLLPWVWFGALGGALETVLVGTASAAIGWYAAELLAPGLWAAIGRHGTASPARVILVGGTIAGVGLLLLAAAIGQPGLQLAAMLVLPPLGYAAAAIVWAARRDSGAPVGVLVGLAIAGPLAFFDAEEVSLLLAIGREVPFWAAVATATALAAAVVVGLVLGFGLGRRRAGWPSRPVAAATAVVLALAGTAVYLTVGQPGLHGERVFVVMREQADLSEVARDTGPQARDARVGEVYRLLVDTAERSQAELRRDLDRWGLSYTPYYLVNAIEVDAGLAMRAWLSRRDDVDRVLVSQQLRPLPATVTAEQGDEPAPDRTLWNIDMLGAERVWTELGVNGDGIVVGSSDSGVDGDHPALSGGFRGGDDSWYDPWTATRAPTDHNGHGTHTTGSAVGADGIGVAPGASWVGCVNLARNLGNPARYLDCLQFMLAPFPAGGDPFTDGRPERAPHVLTNSWGCPQVEGCDLGSLRPAAAALAAAGLMMVVAAGNTGPFCDSVDDPPAPYADVFTVGAVDSDGDVTDFSSRGPTPDGQTKPDLVAPGAGILSAMPGGGYTTLDGTSMATPHVAGVVALMWSANPALIGDLDTTARILRSTATDAGTGIDETCGDPANLTGAGLVDAYAAVQAARSAG